MARFEGWTKVPNWLFESPRVSLHAVVVFAAINSFADRNGMCYPSHRRIARHAKCSVTTVKKAIKELKGYGVLTVEHRIIKGEHTSNVYRVRLDPPAFAYADRANLDAANAAATEVGHLAADLHCDAASNKMQLSKTQVEEHLRRPSEQMGEENTLGQAEDALQFVNEEFADFSGTYPRKGDQRAAFRAYRRARRRGVAYDVIMDGLHDQLEHLCAQDEAYIPLAHNWLLGARWEDEDY